MKKLTFKDYADADIHGVFLNTDEFADTVELDGVTLNAVVEEHVSALSLSGASGLPDAGSYLLNEGIVTVYFKFDDLGYLPEPGQRLRINGILHETADEARNDMGMITLHVMKVMPA